MLPPLARTGTLVGIVTGTLVGIVAVAGAMVALEPGINLAPLFARAGVQRTAVAAAALDLDAMPAAGGAAPAERGRSREASTRRVRPAAPPSARAARPSAPPPRG